MGTQYVAKDGNDGNAGTSWAAAKLTIQAALNAIASGDSIYIASGVYAENIVLGSSKRFSLIGVGYVEIDAGGGTGFSTANFAISPSFFQNLTFRNFDSGVKLSYNDSYDLRDVRFIGSGNGIANAGANAGYQVSAYGCLFDGCSYGIFINLGIPFRFTNCTFRNCGVGIGGSSGPSQITGTIVNCIFRNNTIHYMLTLQGFAVYANHNLFDEVSSGHKVQLFNSSTVNDITSFASLQNYASKGQEVNSQEEAIDFADEANGLYHLNLNSSQAAYGVNGTYVGAYPPALALSPNVNAAMYDAPADSTGLAQAGGIWELSATPTGAYRSAVLDLGSRRMIRRIAPSMGLSAPTNVLDYAIADSQPRQWTFRYRTSTTSFSDGDGSPSWIEAALLTDIRTVARYVQVEFTFRDNGA